MNNRFSNPGQLEILKLEKYATSYQKLYLIEIMKFQNWKLQNDKKHPLIFYQQPDIRILRIGLPDFSNAGAGIIFNLV